MDDARIAAGGMERMLGRRRCDCGEWTDAQGRETRVLDAPPFRAAKFIVVALGVVYALSTLLPFQERPAFLDTWFYSIVLVCTIGLALAASLGVATVADGIDSAAMFHAVTGYGCAAVQGPAICGPMAGDVLGDWLAKLIPAGSAR